MLQPSGATTTALPLQPSIPRPQAPYPLLQPSRYSHPMATGTVSPATALPLQPSRGHRHHIPRYSPPTTALHPRPQAPYTPATGTSPAHPNTHSLSVRGTWPKAKSSTVALLTSSCLAVAVGTWRSLNTSWSGACSVTRPAICAGEGGGVRGAGEVATLHPCMHNTTVHRDQPKSAQL